MSSLRAQTAAAIQSVQAIRNKMKFLHIQENPDIITNESFVVDSLSINKIVPVTQGKYAYIRQGDPKTKLYTTGADPCVILAAYIMNKRQQCIGVFLAHYDTLINHGMKDQHILTLNEYKAEEGFPIRYWSSTFGNVEMNIKEYESIKKSLVEMIQYVRPSDNEPITINYITSAGWNIFPYSIIVYAIRDILNNIQETNDKIYINDYGHIVEDLKKNSPSDKIGVDIENPKFYYQLNIHKDYIGQTAITSERMDKPMLGYVRVYPLTETKLTNGGGDGTNGFRKTDKKKWVYGRERVIYIHSHRKEYVRYNRALVAVSTLPRVAFMNSKSRVL